MFSRSLSLVILVCILWIPQAHAKSRLISLKPNITETVYELGSGDQLVGATLYCDYPEAAKKLPRVADYIKADPEKILLLRPDLILASEENSSQKEIYFLMNRGIPVELFSFTTLQETYDSILKLGRVLGKAEQATQVVAKMKAELADLKAKFGGGPVQRALFVVGYDPLVVVGGDNFIDDVFPYLGLSNVAGGSKIKYPTWSTEQIIRSAPDWIVELPMGSENQPGKRGSRLQWWQRFPSIPAVAKGQILSFPVEEIRAVPALPLALEKLGGKIHPVPAPKQP